MVPMLLFLTMKKYEDLAYVQENFVLLTQYLVPILSVWGISFSFIDLIEGDGNEIHYVNHKMKDNLVLIWLGLYLLTIAVGCGVAGLWIENIWMEYIRLFICCCFYTGLLFCAMFCTGSMTLSFLAITLYWLASVFGNQIPIDLLNCYDTRAMSMSLLSSKYIYIMLAAILFYMLGYFGNKRKLHFH